MSARHLFKKPWHFEYVFGFYALWKLLKLFALLRQFLLSTKELSGHKKVVTSLKKKDDDNYKKTLALLKPYLTSPAYTRTLEYSRAKLVFYAVYEVFLLVEAFVFTFKNVYVKLWQYSGKHLGNKSLYSHVLLYLVYRVGLSYFLRLPLWFVFRYGIQTAHGLNTKTKVAFFKHYFLCYFGLLFYVGTLVSGVTFVDHLNKANLVLLETLLVLVSVLYFFVKPYLKNLFFEVKPFSDPDLKKEVDAPDKRFAFTSKDLHVVPATEVSDLVVLTWGLTGFKHVYMNETYLTLGKPSSMALVAHSAGLFRANHFLKTFLLYVLKYGLLLAGYHHFRNYVPLFKSFGTDKFNVTAIKLETFLLFSFPLVVLFNVVINFLRNHSYFYADNHGVKLGYGDELVNFWYTVYREKKWFFNVDPLYGALFGEMPSLFERVYAVLAAIVPTSPRST